MASVNEHVNKGESARDLRVLLDGVQADLAALRASIVGITAKLDADAGVTDTNFASTLDPVANKTKP